MPEYVVNESLPSQEELQQIRQIRESCATEIAALTDPAEDVVGDLRICRFLRSKHGDVKQATDWFRGFLTWRVEYGMDKYRKEVIGRTPESLNEWYAKRANPYMPLSPYAGRTKSGYIVSYMFQGLMDPEKFIHHRQVPLDEDTRIQFLTIEWLLWYSDQLSRAEGRMIYVIKVADFSGMGADGRRNPIFYSDFKNWLFDKLLTPMQRNYCEHDALFCVVNAPWIFRAMMAVASVVMTKRQTSKVCVLGDTNSKEVQAALREHVDDVWLDKHGGPLKTLPGAWPLMTKDQIDHWYNTRHLIENEIFEQVIPASDPILNDTPLESKDINVIVEETAQKAFEAEKLSPQQTNVIPEQPAKAEVEAPSLQVAASTAPTPVIESKSVGGCNWCMAVTARPKK